jgi:GDP-L-fucose synthase
MNKDDAIFVAGHSGLVGSAIVRRVESAGFTRVLKRGRSQLDLTQPSAVDAFFTETRPAYVFLAAARVGGIHANSTYPADFIRDNLQIQTNVIDAAHRHGVRKLLFLGSSCIYPRNAPQPMREDYLLTGSLEPTNEAYAIAKIAGIQMCKAYRHQYRFNAISAMPTKLYGPGDNFSVEGSHVLPALIRRIHEAKLSNAPEVVIWGSGTPRREFLHVDDLADALVFLMKHYDGEQHVNVGWGKDISIRELAELIASVVGFHGRISLDHSRPDGTPQKLLDVTRLGALGWSPRISLMDGIVSTYEWFAGNQQNMRQ